MTISCLNELSVIEKLTSKTIKDEKDTDEM